jgi:hypothetical protein
MRKIVFSLFFVSLLAGLSAQNSPFEIYLEPMSINGLGGLQAYAFGQDQGRWLIVGGRLDGLHRRQPWATFDVAGHNTQLLVIKPETEQVWTRALSSLPDTLKEQLSSTNMEFHQEGNYLYLIGGYGYSATAADHITYPRLTAIDVPDLIEAIINDNDIGPYFRQIKDQQFAVAGGHLNKIYDTYQLVGGNRFDGRYNPMGHASYTQVYTEQVRRFRIQDDGQQLSITHLPPLTDADELHRRDFNVVPQILPNGEEGLTAFSGVFQKTVDLPFLNAVHIDSSGYTPDAAFAQYYNHYHCANLPVFDATKKEMHSIFFGGIAQYYDQNGILVQDNNVPFVKTIARVSRDSSGAMTEYKLPVEMPGLLGASAEFIPNEQLPRYPNGVFKLDSLTQDTTLMGYIYGGISSSAPNIFWQNNGTQSTATDEILKVFLVRSSTTAIDELNEQSQGSLQLQVRPNPTDGQMEVLFTLPHPTEAKLRLLDLQGRLVMERSLRQKLNKGRNQLTLQLPAISPGTYILSLESGGKQAQQKVKFYAE